MLVTREYGSAVRLTTVLTDAALHTGRPVGKSACASCSECVDACPADAVAGADWRVGVGRDALVDVVACRSVAHEMAKTRIGIDETICGICISACPWTQKYLRKNRRSEWKQKD